MCLGYRGAINPKPSGCRPAAGSDCTRLASVLCCRMLHARGTHGSYLHPELLLPNDLGRVGHEDWWVCRRRPQSTGRRGWRCRCHRSHPAASSCPAAALPGQRPRLPPLGPPPPSSLRLTPAMVSLHLLASLLLKSQRPEQPFISLYVAFAPHPCGAP